MTRPGHQLLRPSGEIVANKPVSRLRIDACPAMLRVKGPCTIKQADLSTLLTAEALTALRMNAKEMPLRWPVSDVR